MRPTTRRPRAALAIAAAAIGLAACFGIEAPPSGIASITPIRPPSPSVVRGDTMRDSTGAVAPLRVYAFSQSGDTIRGLSARFTALGPGLHIANDSFVVGDSVRDSVRVVADMGSTSSPVQAPPIGIPVTVTPDHISAPAADTTRIEWTFNPTSVDSLQWSSDTVLSLTLVGEGDTAVTGFIVDYAMTRPLAARGNAPSAFVAASGIRLASARDTTDAAGIVRRSVALNLKQVPQQWLTDALNAYFSTSDVFMDSVTVDARVQPRGYAISGPITKTFVVVIRTRSH